MTPARSIATAQRLARRLHRDRSGVALLEFAFSLPLVLGLGCYGVECANLAMANLRVSQIALNLADNASRVGDMQSDNTSQLREIDINDALTAARVQGAPWNLTSRGRITVSSLEEKNGKQYIHWQRCLGAKSGSDYSSHYGTTPVSAGSQTGTAYQGTQVSSMGPTNATVTAPPSSGVIFVEINYDYSPVVSSLWLPVSFARLRYIGSYVVRDKRVFDRVYNPSPTATSYTCDKYTAT